VNVGDEEGWCPLHHAAKQVCWVRLIISRDVQKRVKAQYITYLLLYLVYI
jgi:hypothetical protein